MFTLTRGNYFLASIRRNIKDKDQRLSCKYAEVNTTNAQIERPNKGPAGISFRVAANRIPKTGNQIRREREGDKNKTSNSIY